LASGPAAAAGVTVSAPVLTDVPAAGEFCGLDDASRPGVLLPALGFDPL
jgi:hypothetical protein